MAWPWSSRCRWTGAWLAMVGAHRWTEPVRVRVRPQRHPPKKFAFSPDSRMIAVRSPGGLRRPSSPYTHGMSENVISLVDAGRQPLHDVPHMLRRLAERIEEGEFGDTKDRDFFLRCVCVVRASRLEPIVMGFGAEADPNQAFCDLHAGAAQLMAMDGRCSR